MKRLSAWMSAAVCAGTVASAEYKPAAAPLMTEWGERMTPETAWREYPRPQLVRDNWVNLNGLWDYAVTPKDAEQPAEWQGQILVPFAIESALSGVGRLLNPSDLLWYRRTFAAQPANGTRLLLHFGAVDFRTQVWVNGVEVSDVPNEGGNLPFTLDITDAARAGENELVLAVWDPSNEGIQSVGKQVLKPHGCMYTRVSGIWQTAWLERVPETYVAGYTVVTDIDAGTVAVTVQTAGDLAGARAKVEALRGGKTVASGEVKGWGRPVTLTIKKPLLWSPETPDLYDLRITLDAKPGGRASTDTVKGYFGMRKIEWRADEKGVPRFYLNNQKTFLQGTLDQGWWPDGLLTPPSDEAMAFDITLLKQSGFNMMRKHIKVEPLRYYYLCDTLGILVWQDMVSGGGDRENRYGLYRRELKGMMDLLQAVPSIVMWVPYNEGWGQPGRAKTNMTQTWVKRYDPTRLVNGPSGWTDHGVGDARDMHKYPGPDMFPVMADRLSVLGEFGGIGLAIEGHTWAQGGSWGYVSDKTTEASFARYTALMGRLARLAAQGLAASVYTQTSDVEIEINGLVTYDRKHVKYPPAELAALHRRVYDAAQKTVTVTRRELVPSSQKTPQVWKYTFAKPADGWEQAGFDDGAWTSGEAGFGNARITEDYKDAKARTVWDTPAIWLRRSFEFSGEPPASASLSIFYDEDAEVYLNGVLLRAFKGYNTRYASEEIDAGVFAKALRQGRNVLAVKAVNAVGGAFIDLGIDSETEK
ncbi:MAG: beta galactosidase jelly roll domain-containing protein [Verrucomicrobiota bacterium]|jgi:hypothetical protein|nr:beta galactosidase jelly roll domain-containing protein [Verrucomicrobiota bacterium]